MSDDSWRVRLLARHATIERIHTAGRAEGGNPTALREILEHLTAFLRGEIELEPAYAKFCIKSLEAFLSTPKVWDEAVSGFDGLDFSNTSPKEMVTKRGPRLPEKVLRRIGSAFCRAFALSKPQGTEEYHFLLTPDVLWKIFYVRLYGASLPRAKKIVRSAINTKISDRQIKEWLIRASWLKLPEPGTYGFFTGQHHRRLKLATHVLHRTVRGMSLDQACKEVAEIAIKKFSFLPLATVFLEPKTVKEAYSYATTCGDPRWDRVERLVRRFAEAEQAAKAPHS